MWHTNNRKSKCISLIIELSLNPMQDVEGKEGPSTSFSPAASQKAGKIP